MSDDQARLESFIDKFAPDVAAQTRAMLDYMQGRIPGATIPVYDNYNALAIGFGPDDRVKHVVLSLAVFPRWVTLCFTWGVKLPDPLQLLKGGGNQVRSLRLTGPAHLADPGVDALISAALDLAVVPIDANAPGGLVIKSISAKQRPRRP
jgi:hypothetical protein